MTILTREETTEAVPSDAMVRAGEIECREMWKVFGPNPVKAIEVIRKTGEVPAGHTAAVRDLSFRVEAGEKFVIMGLSGSGKSTLVRCLTRLIEPTSGTVTISGRAVTGMRPAELREVRRHQCAMVFQHFGLLGHKSVLANAAYGLEVQGVERKAREERARDVLSIVGLTGWEDRFPDELSGGMKQRVGLARALAVDPKVLLLDEPFSALDPLIRRELQDELLRLADRFDKTLVFITHDMSEALKLGDRIAIMRQGSLVQLATPEDILLRPADEYVAKFTVDMSRARFVRAHGVAEEAQVVQLGELAADARAVTLNAGAAGAVLVNAEGEALGVVSRARLEEVAQRGGLAEEAARSVPIVEPDAPLLEISKYFASGEEVVVMRDRESGGYGLIHSSNVIGVLAGGTL